MSAPLVILGNGPSLKGFDFKRLERFDAIGMNAAYRYWREIGWYPRYYICLDKVVGLSHKDEIAKLIRDSDAKGIELFLLRRNLIATFDEDVQRSPRVLDFDALRASVDAFDPVPFTTGSHSALFGALLGYREMVLLGVDCNYVEKVSGARQSGTTLEIVDAADNNPNYFFDGYQAAGDRYNIPNPVPDLHVVSWHAAAPRLAAEGILVWNGSPISKLKAFPFRSFDEIEAEVNARGGRMAGGVLPRFCRYEPSDGAQTDAESEAGEAEPSSWKIVPASLKLRVANWLQRRNAPALIAVGQFAVWCAGEFARRRKAIALAAAAFATLAILGALSSGWRWLFWSIAALSVLAGILLAISAYAQSALRRRIHTLELALALRRPLDTAPPEIPASLKCVWPARATLGESPCWDARSGRLYFTDIKAARVHAYDVETGARRSWTLPSRIGSIAVRPTNWSAPEGLGDDLLLAAGDVGLTWVDLSGDEARLAPIAHPEAHLRDNRFNDGKLGPDGRYWAGTVHDAEIFASGALYAFSPDGNHAQMDGGYRVTNGPAFSPDGRVVYHADSALQTVYAFDLEPDGGLANKRVFVRFGPGENSPDGMTTDHDGNLWIAIWDGSRLEKISPHGRRIGQVRLPTARPTSCVFVGGDEKTLYVTSASIGLPQDDAEAGGLFEVRLGGEGRP